MVWRSGRPGWVVVAEDDQARDPGEVPGALATHSGRTTWAAEDAPICSSTRSSTSWVGRCGLGGTQCLETVAVARSCGRAGPARRTRRAHLGTRPSNHGRLPHCGPQKKAAGDAGVVPADRLTARLRGELLVAPACQHRNKHLLVGPQQRHADEQAQPGRSWNESLGAHAWDLRPLAFGEGFSHQMRPRALCPQVTLLRWDRCWPSWELFA